MGIRGKGKFFRSKASSNYSFRNSGYDFFTLSKFCRKDIDMEKEFFITGGSADSPGVAK